MSILQLETMNRMILVIKNGKFAEKIIIVCGLKVN
jgi:hypothetical protein